MTTKDLKFGTDAHTQMIAGASILAEAVKATLGPKGRNIVIEKRHGPPSVTKDGVSVAKEVELEDKFQNMGAQMLREVAAKTSEVAGDGTTTPHGTRPGHHAGGLQGAGFWRSPQGNT